MITDTPVSPSSIILERHSRSKTIDKLAAALAKAQGQMINAEKDTPGVFGSYATLASTWNVIRKPLSDNEISIYQRILTVGGKPTLCTMLLHSSGEFFDDCELELKFESGNRMSAMQAMGSAITYARRYSLQAVTGVAPADDDDGAGAGNPKEGKEPAPKKAYSKPTPKEPSNPEPKIEIIPPGEFIMPLGSPAVVGKKLKDLDAETLQKVVNWSQGEIKANKKPENKIALIKINTNAQLVLNSLPKPPEPPPEPIEVEGKDPEGFEQQFPVDAEPPDMAPPPPTEQDRPVEQAWPKEWHYKLPIDFTGLGLKGQALGDLPELSIYTISQDLEKMLRKVPPPANLSQLMEIKSSIKKFFKTVQR